MKRLFNKGVSQVYLTLTWLTLIFHNEQLEKIPLVLTDKECILNFFFSKLQHKNIWT